jgi:hypothetical protein
MFTPVFSGWERPRDATDENGGLDYDDVVSLYERVNCAGPGGTARPTLGRRTVDVPGVGTRPPVEGRLVPHLPRSRRRLGAGRPRA